MLLLLQSLNAQVSVSMNTLLGGQTIEGNSLTLAIVPFILKIKL